MYVVYSRIDECLFIYNKAEVRLPSWVPGSGVDQYSGDRKAYNDGRDKRLTRRCTVNEVIQNCIIKVITLDNRFSLFLCFER